MYIRYRETRSPFFTQNNRNSEHQRNLQHFFIAKPLSILHFVSAISTEGVYIDSKTRSIDVTLINYFCYFFNFIIQSVIFTTIFTLVTVINYQIITNFLIGTTEVHQFYLHQFIFGTVLTSLFSLNFLSDQMTSIKLEREILCCF